MKDLDNALGSWQGAVANARGVCLEDDRELILVSGWNSKEVCQSLNAVICVDDYVGRVFVQDQEAFKSKNLKIFENLQEFAVLDTKLYTSNTEQFLRCSALSWNWVRTCSDSYRP